MNQILSIKLEREREREVPGKDRERCDQGEKRDQKYERDYGWRNEL